MSVHRIMGVETEYGISALADPQANPVLLSSQVVTAYGTEVMPTRPRRMRWDYDVETPLRDARGFDMSRADADPSQLTDDDYGLANLVLFNGARFYVDHAHPEYSSPEVTNPRDAALWDVAGDRIMQESARLASSLTGQLITAYKNNTDGQVSYGTHENYQVSRATPFPHLVKYLTPFFVTRCIYSGAGRVGIGQESLTPGFQISQRADYFEAEVGLETTLRRPIINTRDEPHANPEDFRRLHVIVGDANMSQKANYLKLGTTSLVLSMIEAGFLNLDLELRDPVSAMHQVSHDINFERQLELRNGKTISALDIQELFIDSATRYVESSGTGDDMTLDVLHNWTRVVSTLRSDKMSLANEVDWILKYSILEGYRQRDNAQWTDSRLAAVDIQYSDLRPDKGLGLVMQRKGRQDVMFTESQIIEAINNPPEDTRAYFRGMCMRNYTDQIAAASWDSVIFDLGPEEPLHRIPTSDARKGTRETAGVLFDRQLSAHELVAALGA
jgi:proteasome accessory factor A